MSILNELIETEYKTEYINNHKTGKLMDKKNYSAPKIYPKIIEQKRLSAFTEKQKRKYCKGISVGTYITTFVMKKVKWLNSHLFSSK